MGDAQQLLEQAEELQLEQVEIEQVHEKLEEAKVWMEEAAVLLASKRSTILAFIAFICSLSTSLPAFLAAAICTCISTELACSPPITPIRAFGHIHMKRGE